MHTKHCCYFNFNLLDKFAPVSMTDIINIAPTGTY